MKTVEVFLGADLRCSHQGLIELAAKHGVMIKNLKPGEAIVYINAKKDRLKVLSWNRVLSYVNFTGDRKLDLDALSEIPKAISPDGTMDYKKALRVTLQKKLGQKRFEELEML